MELLCSGKNEIGSIRGANPRSAYIGVAKVNRNWRMDDFNFFFYRAIEQK